jgi:hypothetical protein
MTPMKMMKLRIAIYESAGRPTGRCAESGIRRRGMASTRVPRPVIGHRAGSAAQLIRVILL